MSDATPVDGDALARGFLEQSPFGKLVGFELVTLEPDRAVLRLPYREELATAGRIVHGGAIGALIDTAATLAAWSTRFERMPTRWGTVSLTINLERPADGVDLTADAAVTRRGRSLCFCQVSVRTHEQVAHGSVVYSLVR